MEKTVTLRFYDVSRTSENRPAFADIVRLIGAKGLADRERRIGPDEVLVRLEDFAEEGGCVSGQLVRGQTGNRPGRMMPAGTDALPFEEPLGHGIAFRYRLLDGLLAIQYDTRVLAPSRMLGYLEAHEPRAEFRLIPRMRDDAWQRFDDLPLRKLEVGVAGAPNALDLERGGDSVWSNIARIKQRYGADTVKFQISMGNRGGALLNDIKNVAREAFRRNRENSDDIRSIRGVLQTGEGIPNDEVDLMGELYDSKAELIFNENDFARFYTLRQLMLTDRIRRL